MLVRYYGDERVMSGNGNGFDPEAGILNWDWVMMGTEKQISPI